MHEDNDALTRYVNPYLIALTVMIPTFMVLMDTSIVSVALPYIAGPLCATPDDAAWSLTVYLAASAIVLPVTSVLSQRFGRKTFYLAMIAGFTISSFLCGTAPSLDLLLIFRAIQGFAGGALMPLSQSILMESFPPEKRTQAMSIFSVGVMFGPIMGPFLGGYIAESYSWHWLFLINVPFGILASIMVKMFVYDQWYAQATHDLKIDYISICYLIVGIGALQVALDRGQEDNWLSSNFIVVMCLLCFFFILMFLIRDYFSDKPFIRIALLNDRNYAIGSIALFFLGMIFFVTITLLPQMAQTLLGYDAYTSGLVMMPGGIASLIVSVLMGQLYKKVNLKLIMLIGIGIVLFSLYVMQQINLTASVDFIALGRILIGFGLPFIFIPVNVLAFAFLKNEDVNEASSVLNFMRSIGGSLGISLVIDTFTQRQAAYFRDIMVSRISASSAVFNNLSNSLSQYLFFRGIPFPDTGRVAIALTNRVLNVQADMMSFQDAFRIMMGLSLAFLLLVPLFRIKRAYGEKRPSDNGDSHESPPVIRE